ncbi:hypothetical protein M231_04683 [Tremella mesenterica]|uniref:Uncharacterized protein n=1 Tax=Tremella mesenterica TaxID=5217 RepID=A0A4Q1BJV5_TREME|nr:hypothetical protein M231_04683 [Tremella mesenterica]
MLANEAGKIFLLASIQYDNQVRTNTNENNVHTGKCVDTENGKDGNKDNEPAFELCGVAWLTMVIVIDGMMSAKEALNRSGITPRGWKYYEMTYPPPRSAISYSTQFKKNMPKTQSCPAPTIMP